jgi:hypothetical protein
MNVFTRERWSVGITCCRLTEEEEEEEGLLTNNERMSVGKRNTQSRSAAAELTGPA